MQDKGASPRPKRASRSLGLYDSKIIDNSQVHISEDCSLDHVPGDRSPGHILRDCSQASTFEGHLTGHISKKWLYALFSVSLLLGFFTRFMVLLRAPWEIGNLEELHQGAVALAILKGPLLNPGFYVGVDYGLCSVINGYLASLFFRIFGFSLFSLEMVPLMLFLLAQMLFFLWFVHIKEPNAGLIFSFLLALLPPKQLFISLSNEMTGHENYFFFYPLIFILASLTANTRNDNKRRLYSFLTGLMAGFGSAICLSVFLAFLSTAFLFLSIKREKMASFLFFLQLGLIIGLCPLFIFVNSMNLSGEKMDFSPVSDLNLHMAKTWLDIYDCGRDYLVNLPFALGKIDDADRFLAISLLLFSALQTLAFLWDYKNKKGQIPLLLVGWLSFFIVSFNRWGAYFLVKWDFPHSYRYYSFFILSAFGALAFCAGGRRIYNDYLRKIALFVTISVLLKNGLFSYNTIREKMAYSAFDRPGYQFDILGTLYMRRSGYNLKGASEILSTFPKAISRDLARGFGIQTAFKKPELINKIRDFDFGDEHLNCIREGIGFEYCWANDFEKALDFIDNSTVDNEPESLYYALEGAGLVCGHFGARLEGFLDRCTALVNGKYGDQGLAYFERGVGRGIIIRFGRNKGAKLVKITDSILQGFEKEEKHYELLASELGIKR